MYEYLISYERWSEITLTWNGGEFRTTDDAFSMHMNRLINRQSFGEIRELKFERI